MNVWPVFPSLPAIETLFDIGKFDQGRNIGCNRWREVAVRNTFRYRGVCVKHRGRDIFGILFKAFSNPARELNISFPSADELFRSRRD